MKRFILLILLVTFSVPAFSNYIIYGAGVDSCGTWTQKRRLGGSASFQWEQWVTGWVSAAGFYSVERGFSNDSGNLADTDTQAIWAWIDNYCSRNPLNDIPSAAAALVEELARRAE